MFFRDPINDDRIDAERLAGVADCRARTVGRDGGRERRACARVLPVDVLNDLFPALMLKVDVDIEPWS